MKARFSALFLLLAAFGPSLWAQEPTFRAPTARPDTTIFSPLDLPPANNLRTADGAPGPDYWQQQVDYRIQASLDPETRLVQGSAHITYHNESPNPLDYLWLSLEQNAFREDSIAAKIGGATAVGMTEAEGDGYTILALKAKGKDLEYHVYDTLARVELPKAIKASGGTFEFDVTWEFTIPQHVFRRFGIAKFSQGKVYEVAQWFPAVATYDDVHGWNTLPYIGTGEFYSNYGTYDVEITVPREMIVVATGELQNEKDVFTSEQVKRLKKARKSEETVIIRDADEIGDPKSRPQGKGPLTWKYHAENVRTFAWACSDIFILDAASYEDTLIQSAYPKDGLPVWGSSTQMLRTAIKGYSERWFPYPYPVATNVFGAEGGMEYPMIIFCRGRSESGVYGVTTHEIGHNWFPMMVNTDERRHAWMDEGFNTFINGYSTEDWFGPRKHSENDPASFAPFMMAPDQMPIETLPDVLSGRLLGMLEYMKTGVGLTLLRETILGPERFDYAFRTYIKRWAFKSPQPADFFRCMEDAAGMDLAWFWRGWFYETGWLDQAVSGISQPKGKKGARIRFDNLGGLVMPLHFQVRFEDGSTQDFEYPVEIWYQSNRIIEEIPGGKRIAEVVIDKYRKFPDVKRSNNKWTVAAEEGTKETTEAKKE